MQDRFKILIVGGYGVFGGRFVELLEDEPRLSIIISGRSEERAKKFCHSRFNAKAILIPSRFDRIHDPVSQLKILKPDILIDASGPFQEYGADRYNLVEACISCRIHYLDLADGSGFVEGIKCYDEEAKKSGIFVFSGVSSFPVLTAIGSKKGWLE